MKRVPKHQLLRVTGRHRRDWERREEGFFAICAVYERVLLRLLVLGCFTLELGRFVWWLLISGH
jgi:hypothetical protein